VIKKHRFFAARQGSYDGACNAFFAKGKKMRWQARKKRRWIIAKKACFKSCFWSVLAIVESLQNRCTCSGFVGIGQAAYALPSLPLKQ